MRRQHGFTLLEILVAFTLFGIVVTALFELFQTGLGTLSKTERISKMSLLAQSQLSALAAYPDALEQPPHGMNNGIAWQWRFEAISTEDIPNSDGRLYRAIMTVSQDNVSRDYETTFWNQSAQP